VVATAGELFAEFGDLSDSQGEYRRGVARLLEARQRYPALCAAGERVQLPTNDDSRYYAFIREPAGAGERVLVVLNFQPEPRAITVELGEHIAGPLSDIWSGATYQADGRLTIELPGLGYGIYAATQGSFTQGVRG
jgi:hypothetical protein